MLGFSSPRLRRPSPGTLHSMPRRVTGRMRNRRVGVPVVVLVAAVAAMTLGPASLASAAPKPKCPQGSTYNATTGKCEVAPTMGCPIDATYDASRNVCVYGAPTECPLGSQYDPASGKCWVSVEGPPGTSCPDGFYGTYDGGAIHCQGDPGCTSGQTVNTATNKCEGPLVAICPTSFPTYNQTTGKCEGEPVTRTRP